MAEHNYTDELQNAVSKMLSQSPHELFEKLWELYNETTFVANPKGIYFRVSSDATYRNLVVAGETSVVDIEADETNADGREISVSPYRAHSAVILHMGPILTLPDTQNSLLTVACLIGSNSIGPYWSAHNEDEVERLRRFARILVKSVSL